MWSRASCPALLQTADYVRALFAASATHHSTTELANAVAVRVIRQKRLTSTDDPLRLVAIVFEPVLHTPVGGPEVLAAQLRHLESTAQLDSVTLQVLPTAVGAHVGMASGFTVLSFGDLGEPDMAYVEHALGAMNVEKAADVATARLKFDRLRFDALSPADSLALLRRIAGQT